MAATTFYIPAINLMGSGCLKEAATAVESYGWKKALIVTDKPLVNLGVVGQVAELLSQHGVTSVVYDEVKPNPNVTNVEHGLTILKDNQCDFVISLGGGSPHDCAKAIALVAANGGAITDYEGVDQSAKPQLPLVAINTTAGTASEMTRFCIITDDTRHVKMAIVDKHTTPVLSVNDSDLMLGMPPSLTAATGMDALTHAIEAYVSTAATPITDACALQAVTLISDYLRTAVSDGKNEQAREKMAYAEFLAGMAFNNASLGYVHAMAHQLGGFYDLPHGVCNAILLPHVQTFNAQVAADRLGDVAKAMGCDVSGKSADDAAQICIDAIRALAADVNIPAGVAELGMKEEDIPTLAENAMKDACGVTNPIQPTFEQVCQIFKEAM
ncbi:MAG: L-threonine dehydrogenase [Oceanospirillaceae bacterium]|nr:L-threonine dehydrogenase [Oceanospirillaceae bacterium]MBT12444.1 L-threonine dehydrogenase [Oceanospirillaceae bacterium]|tara:strand:+ start:5627 stop:6778 length:1152 start_codon:yes stop_codon:yes gene_type:complete